MHNHSQAPHANVPPHLLIDGAFCFWEIAQQHPERVAVVSVEGTATLYGPLLERCNRMANLLRSLGLGHGDAVAVLYPNDVEMIAITLATLQIGVQLVPLNWHLTPDEMTYLLANSDSRVLFAHARFDQAAEAAANQAGIAPAMRLGSEAFGSFKPLEPALQQQPKTEPTNRQVGAVMFYTSGTTGRPKGVRRPINPDKTPEQALASYLPWYMGLWGLQAGTGAHLVVAPLYHAAPHSRAIQMLHLGHTVVLMDKWLPENMLQLIERHHITSTQMVPIMFHRLLQLPPEVRRRYKLDSLIAVIHAAAPCPVSTKQKMIDWWGPVIHEFYAATEGGGTSLRAQEWLQHPGSVGRAYPVARVAVLDDQGNELPAGEVGLIYLDDGIGFEYYKDQAKTAASRKRGMFTAGDYGYLDAEGWLYICDRRVDLIISGGVNIYPAEIEAALLGHAKVGDVAVIGLPDEEWGQRVHAIVEPAAGVVGNEQLTQELLAWCEGRLASFKWPKAIDYEVLPRTDAGKIGRGRLRESFLARQVSSVT